MLESRQLLQAGIAALGDEVESWRDTWLGDSRETHAYRVGRLLLTPAPISSLKLSAQATEDLAQRGYDSVNDLVDLSEDQLNQLPITRQSDQQKIQRAKEKDRAARTRGKKFDPWSLEKVYQEIHRESEGWADENFPGPPKLEPTPPPDNFGAFGGGAVVFVMVALGLLAAIILHPLIALFSIPGILLFAGFTRYQYTSPEEQKARHRREHQEKLRVWQESRNHLSNQLAQSLRVSIIRSIAEKLGVPERLDSEFVDWMIQNSSRTKIELSDELQEWSRQPEFPPAPAAQLESISHEEYEEYCWRTLLSWGYLDAKTTRYVRDGGIDIESEELVVQCKHVVGNVRVPEVQAIFGIAAHKSKTAVVFSAGGYTKDAATFANKAGVALFRLTEYDGKAKAENEAAARVISRKTERS